MGTRCSGVRVQVPLKILPHGKDLPYPFYATPHSAGMDILAAITEPKIINPSERTLVPSGLCIALPSHMEAQIRSRSGLALKNGICVLNAPGTIDADYRGEIGVILVNFGENPFTLERGMRIAQVVFATYCSVQWQVVDNLPITERNTGGFGSTGH